MSELFPAPEAHDAGSGKLFALPAGTQGHATFGGPAQCYRYRLVRVWDPALPIVLMIMMNPSTANPLFDDRTVAKCGRMARRWGAGTLWVGNTFAYRTTDQRRLAEVEDPVGPENDFHLHEMARAASLVIMAYGTPTLPQLQRRGPEVARYLAGYGIPLHVLRLSPKGGVPMHPLYIPDATEPVRWKA